MKRARVVLRRGFYCSLVRVAALLSPSADKIASQLVAASTLVHQTLYVVVDDRNLDGKAIDVSEEIKERLEILERVYLVATSCCPDLDVRVLFSHDFASENVNLTRLQFDVEVAFVEGGRIHGEVLRYLQARMSPFCDVSVENIPRLSPEQLAAATKPREVRKFLQGFGPKRKIGT